MGWPTPPPSPPPRYGMARPPGWQEGETLPRDSARGDDRCRPEAEAGAPRDGGQGTWQGHLRVPAVRGGVPVARVAQEGEGAPPAAGGRDASVPVPRGRSGTGSLTAARPRGRWRPLGLLRLSHWRGPRGGPPLAPVRLLHLFFLLLRFPPFPLPVLHPPRVEEGGDEGHFPVG